VDLGTAPGDRVLRASRQGRPALVCRPPGRRPRVGSTRSWRPRRRDVVVAELSYRLLP